MSEFEDSAIGMARPSKTHGRIESRVNTYFAIQIDQHVRKYKGLETIPEEPASDDRDGLTPDVTVKNENGETVLLVEITDDKNFEEKKAQDYRSKGITAEIYVIDYIEKKWYKFDDAANKLVDATNSAIFFEFPSKLNFADIYKKAEEEAKKRH